jgi:hypothetical protein
MAGGLLIGILTAIIAFSMINSLKSRYPFLDAAFLKRLFFYHLALAIVYYLYAAFNPSDSKFYYVKVITDYRGDTWGSFYGTSTTFIEFIGYPFIRFLGFSYEAVMILFALFGFIGYLYFYIFFQENIRFKHQFLGIDLMKLIFFLPNLHFWSSSFGKGSVIFMGIALCFYGISKIQTRWLAAFAGAFIVYHVRPHILLVLLVSSALGFVFSTKGVSLPLRLAFLAVVAVAFYFIYGDVLTLVGVDEQEFLTQGLNLTNRARELSKTTSGVDISNYSLPMQIFTFLYRPLFVDAPGLLGLIVSVENVFYLIMTVKILNFRGIKFIATGDFLTKTAFFGFCTVTIALAQIAGNLGLAMRQKSQIMMLLLYVIMVFMDNRKLKDFQKAAALRLKRKGTITEVNKS